MSTTPSEPYSIPVLAAAAIRDTINVIIVTATDVERDAVRSEMRPIPGTPGLGRVRTATQSFYIGYLGNYPVAHVECTMGAIGIGASQNTVNDAIAFWSPKLVVMPGIAFGMDPRSQALEDILIADSIVAYEPARMEPGNIVRRGREIPAGVTILERLRDERGWHDGKKPKVGLMLSGEKLVDDPTFKAALLREYPTAIGGEMEGAGVASACQRHGVQWALVKAICDWGDGKKNKRHQPTAAQKAVAFVTKTFWGKDLLPNLPVDITASAYRLISGKRSRFVRSVGELSAIADLFSEARAPALFGADAADVLAHAARELMRNALIHGRASTASVEIGEDEVIMRDDGAAFDPRRLGTRPRALARDAGSFVMAELVANPDQFEVRYRWDSGAAHNIISIRSLAPPRVEPACTIPPISWNTGEPEIENLIHAASHCSEIYYDVRHNYDLSSQWQAVSMLLNRLGKDQLLVVLNASDRLLIGLLSEFNHPQLVFRANADLVDEALTPKAKE